MVTLGILELEFCASFLKESLSPSIFAHVTAVICTSGRSFSVLGRASPTTVLAGLLGACSATVNVAAITFTTNKSQVATVSTNKIPEKWIQHWAAIGLDRPTSDEET